MPSHESGSAVGVGVGVGAGVSEGVSAGAVAVVLTVGVGAEAVQPEIIRALTKNREEIKNGRML